MVLFIIPAFTFLPSYSFAAFQTKSTTLPCYRKTKQFSSIFGRYLIISMFFVISCFEISLCEAQQEKLSVSINENVPIGSSLINLRTSTVASACKDKKDDWIKSPTTFKVSSNYELVTKGEIDREKECSDRSNDECVIEVLILCRNPFSTLKVLITILDENDNSPSFLNEKVNLSMPENTPQNTEWALEVAKDPDSNANGVKKYSLICQNCDEDSKDVFKLIDEDRRSTDNAILPKLKLMSSLDHEDKDLFIFKISAFDVDNNAASYLLNITVSDINDNAPIFTQSSLKLTIPEDQPVGSIVGSVQATDLDSGRNGEIEYGFSTQESLPETVRCFEINKTSGEIKLIQSLKNQGGKHHEVNIYARDKATGSPLKDELTWKFSILEKNDFVPQIKFNSLEETDPEVCQIPENNEIGRVIGYFEVTDKDEGVFGETDFVMVNGSNLFELTENNGFYFVKLLKRFNREEQENYTVTVIASDCKNDLTCDRLESILYVVFTVCDENDNDPTFLTREKKLTVEEEDIPGYLFTFEAFDRDTGRNGEIEYFIPDFDVSSFFSIDNETGHVYSVKPLDRELLGDVIGVPIGARDKGNPVRTGTARLTIELTDINDNKPRFVNPPKFLQLFENSAPGVVIGTIEAVDDDKEKAKILYFAHKNSSKLFQIDKNSGQVTATTSFDYEKIDQRFFDLWIVATEDSNRAFTSVLYVQVQVIDKNDNIPIIDFAEKSVEIPWDADENYEVTRILAHDEDSGENGRIRFILKNQKERFDINSNIGALYVRDRQNIKRDKDSFFEVKIEVSDCAKLDPSSDTVTILVTFSGNMTLFNHTDIKSIGLPMTWDDIEGYIGYIACGTVFLVAIIILIWVALVIKCRRNNHQSSQYRGAHHRTGSATSNSKFLIPERDIQFSSNNNNSVTKRTSSNYPGSNVRSLSGTSRSTYSNDPNYVHTGVIVQDLDQDFNCGSKDVSPTSTTNVDDSMIFANEMMHHGAQKAPQQMIAFSNSNSNLNNSGGPTTCSTLIGAGNRRQISEPVTSTCSNLSPTTSEAQSSRCFNNDPRRQANATTGGGSSLGPNSSFSDMRSSSSPEPAGSDSSSFDSGRGSEAQMDASGYNSGILLASMRGSNPSGAKSLPAAKKNRHTPPSPMYGDYREDDCWQPRASGGISNTLPTNRQSNNPDIPTKGGILITPARQILQPPASNHEKWNLPRDGNTFKQNSSNSNSANNNSNGHLNRIGLTELEPIAENFDQERNRAPPDQLISASTPPDIVKSSAQNHSQPLVVGLARNTQPPKRTPPSIPIENPSESRTAVV